MKLCEWCFGISCLFWCLAQSLTRPTLITIHSGSLWSLLRAIWSDYTYTTWFSAALCKSRWDIIFVQNQCSTLVGALFQSVYNTLGNLIMETRQSNMTISHFERFHFSNSSRLLWPVLGWLPAQIKWLSSLFLSTFPMCWEKPAGSDRATPAVWSNHLVWENNQSTREVVLA